MKQNYLLVAHNKYSDEIIYKYFDTLENMKDYIKISLNQKRYWKILHKFELKEVK